MKCLLFLVLFVSVVAFSAQRGAAATLTVTNGSDSGAGSLRQAILDAASGDTINFSLPANSSTITLTSAELLIDKNLTITGPGADQLTVQRSTAGGTPDFSIFHITSGSDVTISDLTISNGSSGDGGGILNEGTVTVSNSAFSSNVSTSGDGAGLYNDGTATVSNSTFSSNATTDGDGAGLYNEGTATVSNSTFSSNVSTSGDGAGLYNDGTATVSNSIFSSNATTSGNGAGLYNDGTATVIGSTLSGNSTANGDGAGLYNDGTATVTGSALMGNSSTAGGDGGGLFNNGTTNLTNCTVNGNSTAGGGDGGGLYDDDTVNVTNCTFSGNSTTGGGAGGGIFVDFETLNIKNTIVALNTSDGAGPDVSGDFTSQGFNLIGQSDGSTGFTNGVNGDQAGSTAAPLDPLLGSLQNNGGPTFTQALLFGSPAIDQGAAANDPSTGDPITTDQRGMTRPVDRPNIANAMGGNGSDIGAFEVQTPSLLLNISTRLNVLTGDNVLIGGFIVTGTAPKKVIVRGIGPSLNIPGDLADPFLELHSDTATIATNDNWKDTQEAEIMATGIPPTNDLESAIVETLDPGSYTVILSGKSGGTGVGLVEVYDLDQAAASQLANISSRGFVDTGNNVMIGGFIVGGGGGGGATVIVRAIGPSLTAQGVTNALADPTLDLYDVNGTVIASDDNWKDTQEAEVIATTIPPTNDAESAIVDFLVPGAYTAIVRGVNSTTGVALVEIYNLD